MPAIAERVVSMLLASGPQTLDEIVAAVGPNCTSIEIIDAVTLLVGNGRLHEQTVDGATVYATVGSNR